MALNPALADDHEGMLDQVEDNTSITLSGTVLEAREDEFDLQVGNDTVTIEIDDEIRDGGAYELAAGDRVTASGRVDDDLFEGKEIAAEAIHVDKLDTTFIIDEEYADQYGMNMGRNLDDTVSVTGTVIKVADDEFRIRAGIGEFTVEVDELASNPLDDEGYMKIGSGDSVHVVGEIDDDWLEGREIVASSVSVVRVGYNAN
jgi:uncharacterized protein YdeI (BOF family)